VSVGTLALDPLRLLTWPTSHSALLSGILTLSLTSRCESTPDQPLFYPCMCKGSIRYVHQVCRLLLHCSFSHRNGQLNSFQWCSYTRTRSASRSGSGTATRPHVNFVNTPSAFNLVRIGPALQANASARCAFVLTVPIAVYADNAPKILAGHELLFGVVKKVRGSLESLF